MSMRPHSLAEADAALAHWRERLAAASRNVVELSELPAFLALKARPGTGRTDAAARALVATMDELWQGVLLIGGAIDKAQAARDGGSRLWRGEEAAGEAIAILQSDSIEVATGDLQVLDRGLLASPRAAIHVSPQRLLAAMQQAFERAKTAIAELSEARAKCETARAQIAGMIDTLAAASWPLAAEARARLDTADAPTDPLGALEQIEALRPRLVAATLALAAAEHDLFAARADLAAIAALRPRLDAARDVASRATDAALLAPDAGEASELVGWLERLERTLRSGQLDSFRVGLTRWRDLAGKVRRDTEAALALATAALARRDELRGRFGALRAKQASRAARLAAADPEADALAARLQAALFGTAARLAEAEGLMARYEAALNRPLAASRQG